MLLQFSVENVLSFDSEQVLNLTVTTSSMDHPKHVSSAESYKGGPVLRAAAIYGPNASGKSNLIQALAYAKRLVINGTRSAQPLGLRQFKLRARGINRPSKFEFVIRTRGVLYNYGFRVNELKVLEEWLFATYDRKEVLVFERTTDDFNKTIVRLGTKLTEKSIKKENFLDFVAQGTRYNQLFLTEADERSVTLVQPLVSWFRDVLVVVPAKVQAEGLEAVAHGSKDLTELIGAFVRGAGAGISDVITERMPLDVDALMSRLPEPQRSTVSERLSQLSNDEMADFRLPDGEHYLIDRDANGDLTQTILRLAHEGPEETKAQFALHEESEGTQRLINLLPAIFMLQTASEKVIVLDELDRRFHTHLSRHILRTALACDQDNSRTQLIFTTHDTNLLNLDLLRRDEIWFVEKDQAGASHLYSLAEFKVRPDLKVERGYLAGRFGAIPFISDMVRLGWSGGDQTPEVPPQAIATL